MFVIKNISPAMMRKYRLWLNLTQEAIADLFGVHLETYSRWERGAVKPESPNLVALSFETLLNRRLTMEAAKQEIGRLQDLRKKTDFYLDEIEKIDGRRRQRHRQKSFS